MRLGQTGSVGGDIAFKIGKQALQYAANSLVYGLGFGVGIIVMIVIDELNKTTDPRFVVRWTLNADGTAGATVLVQEKIPPDAVKKIGDLGVTVLTEYYKIAQTLGIAPIAPLNADLIWQPPALDMNLLVTFPFMGCQTPQDAPPLYKRYFVTAQLADEMFRFMLDLLQKSASIYPGIDSLVRSLDPATATRDQILSLFQQGAEVLQMFTKDWIARAAAGDDSWVAELKGNGNALIAQRAAEIDAERAAICTAAFGQNLEILPYLARIRAGTPVSQLALELYAQFGNNAANPDYQRIRGLLEQAVGSLAPGNLMMGVGADDVQLQNQMYQAQQAAAIAVATGVPDTRDSGLQMLCDPQTGECVYIQLGDTGQAGAG